MAGRGSEGSEEFCEGTVWVGYAQQSGILVADTLKVLISSFALSTVDMVTVVRNRGLLSVRPENQSINLEVTGAFGIGMVSSPAFTAGITAVPTPITDAGDEGWLYWTAFTVTCPQIGSAAALGVAAGGSSAMFRATVDSKAMRKFPTDRTLYAAIEVGTEVGTASIDVFFDSRMLVKLA